MQPVVDGNPEQRIPAPRVPEQTSRRGGSPRSRRRRVRADPSTIAKTGRKPPAGPVVEIPPESQPGDILRLLGEHYAAIPPARISQELDDVMSIPGTGELESSTVARLVEARLLALL